MDSLQLAGVADALGAVAEGTRMVIAGEVAQVLGIAAACDLHRVDESVVVAGAERWVPGGADGTPDIGEFVAAELGVVLGTSPASTMVRIADVLNVRHRHPALWSAVCAGQVRFFEAARVAQGCVSAGLDRAACHIVDRHCAVALAMQPWSRVRRRVDGWILLADPAAAAERAAKAAAGRRVEVGQIRGRALRPVGAPRCRRRPRVRPGPGLDRAEPADRGGPGRATRFSRGHPRPADAGSG